MAEITVYDTQTTDENGFAELTSPTQNSTGTKTFMIMHAGADYPVSVQVVNVANVSLKASSYFTYNGGAIELEATATDNNNLPISNLKITIGNSILTTNNRGKAYLTYEGSGSGSKQITASCGNTSDEITIEDVYQYWSQSEQKKYNVSYSKRGQLSIEETTTGILLVTTDEGRMTFENPYRVSESWEFSFKVVGILKKETYLHVSLVNITNHVQNGSEVKVTYNKSSGIRKVFVDDVEVSSSTNQAAIDSDILVHGRIRIDNLKLMAVV